MRVSLIINTYNRLHTLPLTLESMNQLRYPNLEVIVVDGPSTDGTRSYLEETWQGKIKILTCPQANLSISRNIGLLAASGDIIIYTDDDAIPEPDWIEQLIQPYQDPGIACVGGFARDHTGVEYQTQYIVSDRHGGSDEKITDPALLPACLTGHMKFPRPIGVNSSFRRSSLLEIGGFDEEYAYFYDEVDVALRLIDAGYKINFAPQAEVHHKYAKSHIRTQQGIPRTWLPIARSTAYYCVRNASPGQTFEVTLRVLENHRQRLISHTHWAIHHGSLDPEKSSQLFNDIELGMHEGIFDAFSTPWRKLISPCPDDPQPWLEFLRTKPAGQRRRLAFVTDLYPPRPCGGIAVFIHNLAKELARLGHEITVITFAANGCPHTVDFEDGVWVHRLPPSSASTLGMTEIPYMPDGMKAPAQAILNELQRVQPRRAFEWVIGAIWDVNLAAILATKAYPVAMYLVTSYRLMLPSKPEWSPGTPFYKYHVKPMMDAERWALQEADLIFASTHAILADTKDAYELKIEPNRIRVQPFGIPPSSVTPKERLNDDLRILFVGRFERRKGIDILLQILPDLMEINPKLYVTLAGDNSIASPQGKPYWQIFEQQHRYSTWFNRVNAPGLLSDEDLEQAYADCDIFVAPSRYESFGLIYLEAMRMAKPCIGVRVGGIPEVIKDQQTGLLAEPDNPSSLQAAIQKLIDNPALRSSLGQAGAETYRQSFTATAFAQGFLQALDKSTGTKGSSNK